MGVHDPERAIASWQKVIAFYDDWRGHTFWPRARRMQSLIERVIASPAGERYFASQSLTLLGISVYPTYAQRREAPMLWVDPCPRDGSERDGFSFILCGRGGGHERERLAFVAEVDAFAMLTEWLAKLDAEPGA